MKKTISALKRAGSVSLLLILCTALLPALGCKTPQTTTPDQRVYEINKRLGRGINILGYDPIWRDFSKARFKIEYFGKIKAAGFNHVRINLHPFRDNPGLAEETNTISHHYLNTLDWAISNALAQGLMVVVDFHEFTLMGHDPEKYKKAFLKTWDILANHLKNQPDSVLFEILNEPNSKLTPELWNQFLRDALTVIRRTNPNRVVIIGPGQWNSIDMLPKLELPESDRNIIVTIHYYAPFDFTHQGTAFAGKADKVDIRWGSQDDVRTLIQDFDRAQTWAKQHKRPVYLGEFGVYDRAPEPDRYIWLQHVVSEAESRQWSWAYWQFDGNFVAFDVRTEKWNEPVLRAIIPKTQK